MGEHPEIRAPVHSLTLPPSWGLKVGEGCRGLMMPGHPGAPDGGVQGSVLGTPASGEQAGGCPTSPAAGVRGTLLTVPQRALASAGVTQSEKGSLGSTQATEGLELMSFWDGTQSIKLCVSSVNRSSAYNLSVSCRDLTVVATGQRGPCDAAGKDPGEAADPGEA